MDAPTLTLRFLGELSVERAGEPVSLPPSKKTRALLAYLALTGRAHRRTQLCALLWDVADDPRGALRWSLSKLRGLVNDGAGDRIVADRESVEFQAVGAAIDALDVRRQLSAGTDSLGTETLEGLAGSFRGELLEGLELDEFHEFSAWCVAERERARSLQIGVLRALVGRLADAPERVLPHARTLARIDPLDEGAHASVVRVLAALDRWREAELEVEATRRMFAELRGAAPRQLEEIWRGLQGQKSLPRPSAPLQVTAPKPALEPEPPRAGAQGLPFVGRTREVDMLAGDLHRARADGAARAVVLTGEPGVGKTRLMGQLVRMAKEAGHALVRGRAYEAEASRPYGPWIDALSGISLDGVDPALATGLAPLLPGRVEPGPDRGSRERMFAALDGMLVARLEGHGALVLALDDVQWLDEQSATLLHHVFRALADRPLLVALTARSGELQDNEPLCKVLRGLRREGLLREVELGPLEPDEVEALVHAASPAVDASRVITDSAGNPLFALELARALESGETDLPTGLTGIVRDRVDRLSTGAADVLRWGAVLGAVLDVELLEAVVSGGGEELVDALEELQRHALIEPTDNPAHYGFAHALVQRAVYGELSAPRRRLMHLRVAKTLSERDDTDGTIAADVARHGALAGDAALAVRACVGAGKRSLKMFANGSALGFANKGLRLVDDLADPVRTRLRLELFEVKLAGQRPEDPAPIVQELHELGERALDLDMPEHARLAFHLLSYLMWEEGEWADAARHMLHAARVARGSTPQARVRAMAEAARCLAIVERDLAQAEALVREADAMARRLHVEYSVVPGAVGLLRLYQGRSEEANSLFDQALELAQAERNHGFEFYAMEFQCYMALERGDLGEAQRLATEMVALAAKLREGAEAPFAALLVAVTEHAVGPGCERLDDAVQAMRVVDAKHRLATCLNWIAEIDRDRGELDRAGSWAEEALANATALGRPSEAARARAVLLEVALTRGDAPAIDAQRGALETLARGSLFDDVRRRVDAVLNRVPGDP